MTVLKPDSPTDLHEVLVQPLATLATTKQHRTQATQSKIGAHSNDHAHFTHSIMISLPLRHGTVQVSTQTSTLVKSLPQYLFKAAQSDMGSKSLSPSSDMDVSGSSSSSSVRMSMYCFFAAAAPRRGARRLATAGVLSSVPSSSPLALSPLFS
jgi:hypothetical protein